MRRWFGVGGLRIGVVVSLVVVEGDLAGVGRGSSVVRGVVPLLVVDWGLLLVVGVGADLRGALVGLWGLVGGLLMVGIGCMSSLLVRGLVLLLPVARRILRLTCLRWVWGLVVRIHLFDLWLFARWSRWACRC